MLPQSVILDLKGMQYAGSIMPSCTALVVGLGPSEAKIEGITSDVLVLEHVQDLLDSLGGALRAGGVDAALLGFEDVDCAEEHSVAGGASAASAPSASPQGKRAVGGAKRKPRGSDDEDDDGDGGGAADDDADSAPRKKKRAAPGSAAKKPKKMIGRSVKVKGKGGRKKKA